jgi:LacI family transcriptional regulator
MRQTESSKSPSPILHPAIQHILIFAPAASGSRRQIVLGIAQYARKLPQWNLVYEPESYSLTDIAARFRSAHGMITTAPRTVEETQLINTIAIPVVMVGDDRPPFHCVTSDEFVIGKKAAEYFKSLGLHDVAFVGYPNTPFSDARLRGLRETADHLKLKLHHYTRPIYSSIEQDPHEFGPFREWLMSLPRPTGVMTVTAAVGRLFTELCRETNVRVPEDLLVLGVDDDPFVCELAHPALSTIDQASPQVGYRAAQLLDQLMNGLHTTQRQTVILPPRDVIIRQSTAMIRADIPEVSQAIAFIRQSLTRTIRVDHVVEHVALSRRALERAFKRNLNRSIHDEIVRQRIDLARQLLIHSDLTIQDISDRCGFSYLSKFSKTFRDQTEYTPSQFRKMNRT